jgi:predicted RNA-binding Zn-ribbon protein involved in translation (DUF1610 family)
MTHRAHQRTPHPRPRNNTVDDLSKRESSIAFVAMLGGTLLGAVTCEAHMQIWQPVLMPPGAMFATGAACGFIAGLISLTYLLPLLKHSNLRRSLPLVFGATAVVGLGFGVMHPLLGGLIAFVVQVLASIICSARYWHPPPDSPQARSSLCSQCGYDCVGTTAHLCPECGLTAPDLAFRIPLCEACGQGHLETNGTCPNCGAVDLNRRYGLGRV